MARVLKDLPLGLFLCAAGGVIVNVARGLHSIAAQAYGPGFFPGLVGTGIAACGLFMVLRSLLRLRGPQAAAPTEADAPDASPIDRHNLAAMLWVVTGLALITVGMDTIGFLICVPVFMIGFLLLVGESALWSITLSLTTSGLAYYAFAKLLKVQIPLGLMQGWF